jgi:hypothetical protein
VFGSCCQIRLKVFNWKGNDEKLDFLIVICSQFNVLHGK